MLRSITRRRLRSNRRGISNIIVVALSLVIVLAIVSNLVMWNYEMNQVDWEKMKESFIISNVESDTDLTWFTTQSEYTVNTGSKTGGTYVNTQFVDDNFESFIETSSGGLSNTTLIAVESFEGYWWPPFGWSRTGSWEKENDYVRDGTFSADFDGSYYSPSGYLTSPSMDCSNAEVIYVDFWWYDNYLDYDDFELEYYDGYSWDNYQDLDQIESANGWHHYSEAVTDSQYFVSNFRIRWYAKTVNSGETGCVDLVTVEKGMASNLFSLDLIGQFTVDLSLYPLANIQTIEIQLRYKVNDSSEKWYLQAYNWATSTYSDLGFNSTAGHTPTTEWNYFSVNLMDIWQSYVNGDGQVNIKFSDQYTDSEQSSIYIDFLGVRVKMDGTRFSFKNDGGLTVHLVSLWITNSTDHQHYDINIYVNSAETKSYIRDDISLPTGGYIVKVVTERGNTAVYSVN